MTRTPFQYRLPWRKSASAQASQKQETSVQHLEQIIRVYKLCATCAIKEAEVVYKCNNSAGSPQLGTRKSPSCITDVMQPRGGTKLLTEKECSVQHMCLYDVVCRSHVLCLLGFSVSLK